MPTSSVPSKSSKPKTVASPKSRLDKKIAATKKTTQKTNGTRTAKGAITPSESAQKGENGLTTSQDQLYGVQFEERVVAFSSLICDQEVFPNSRKLIKNIDELAASIYKNGLDNPLLVWDQEYEDGGETLRRDVVAAGFRRHAAIDLLLNLDLPRKELKEKYNVEFSDSPQVDFEERFDVVWEESPAKRFEFVKIRSFKGDKLTARGINVRENAEREDLHPSEYGEYMVDIKRENPELQNTQLAKMFCKSEAWVSESIRYAELASPKLKELVRDGVQLNERFKRKEIDKKPRTLSYSNALRIVKKEGKLRQDELVKEFLANKEANVVDKFSKTPRRRTHTEMLSQLHYLGRRDREFTDAAKSHLAKMVTALVDIRPELGGHIEEKSSDAFLDGLAAGIYWCSMAATPNDPTDSYWTEIESIKDKEARLLRQAKDNGDEFFSEKVDSLWAMAKKSAEKLGHE